MADAKFGNRNNPTLRGWTQRVMAARRTDPLKMLRVRNFNVGISQTYDVPDLVTGLTDRITWSKGVIDFRGNLEAPLTTSINEMLVKAADHACLGVDGAILQVQSDVHGGPYSCMVNRLTITANEREAISVSAELIGRVGLLNNETLNSSTDGTEAVTLMGSTGESTGGNVDAYKSEFITEQIPMFDTVIVGEGMNPAGSCEFLQPIGCSLTIDNKLQQNYVLGCGTEKSSLDAYSISAGQRTISGTMRFMSGENGQINYPKLVGMGAGGGTLLNFADMIKIDGTKFRPLWAAKPPQLGVEKVVVELEFVMIATEAGLHSITADGFDA